jgi:hypothetical protein
VSLKTSAAGKDGLGPLPSRMVSTVFSGALGASTRTRTAAVEPAFDLFSPLAVSSCQTVDSRYEADKVEEEDDLVFPHPPTLEDIRRMEPDLSPRSMRRRASDCYEAMPKPDVSALVRVPYSIPASVSSAGQGHGRVGSSGRNKGYIVPDAKAAMKEKMGAIADFVTAYMCSMVRCGLASKCVLNLH